MAKLRFKDDHVLESNRVNGLFVEAISYPIYKTPPDEVVWPEVFEITEETTDTPARVAEITVKAISYFDEGTIRKLMKAMQKGDWQLDVTSASWVKLA